MLFGFTVVLRDDFRTVDALEVGVDLGGDRFRDHGLPRSRRTVEKNTLWRVNAEPTEQFWMLEWQLNHLTDLLKLLTYSTDILVGDAFGLTNIFLSHGFVFDDNLGIGGDHHDALGHGLHDSEGQGLSKEGHAGNENSVASDHGALGEASLSKAFYARAKLHFLLVGHDR